MNPGKIVAIAVIGGLLGAAAGIGWQRLGGDTVLDASATGAESTLPYFTYPDLDGQQRRSNEWANKVVVLNFWASWCPPCREETPTFVQLQEEYAARGVQFVGIAIDDKEPVQEFVDSYGINYPILLGDVDAVTVSKRLGNRFEGLPFTVVIKPGGELYKRHTGGMSRSQLEPVLRELTGAG